MKIHDLKPQKGSRKNLRRVGRGTGAGQGKTAGKGTKGQLARSGPGLPAWFEGGQMPLHMRLPKLRGFKNRQRIEFVAVNGKVSPETLAAKGLIEPNAKVKLLGNGDLGAKLEVHAHRASATARQKIESAGGSVVLIDAGSS